MTDSSLPSDVVEAIAISNAKSIGEQPAILANLALSQQIFNQNMQQQIALSQQSAMNQVQMAAAAKCVSILENNSGSSTDQIEKMQKQIAEMMKQFQKMADSSSQEES